MRRRYRWDLDAVDTTFLLTWVIFLLLNIAFWVAVIWVGIHYARKYW